LQEKLQTRFFKFTLGVEIWFFVSSASLNHITAAKHTNEVHKMSAFLDIAYTGFAFFQCTKKLTYKFYNLKEIPDWTEPEKTSPCCSNVEFQK